MYRTAGTCGEIYVWSATVPVCESVCKVSEVNWRRTGREPLTAPPSEKLENDYKQVHLNLHLGPVHLGVRAKTLPLPCRRHCATRLSSMSMA
eukprot:3353644-Pleurochrysis_carterae.AAC.1